MTDYARRSARVLLLDRDDRVLLFHYDSLDGATVWITPGGGVDAGEGLREAAVRELAEEIGLSVPIADLGPHVAYAEGYAELGWIRGVLRDDYFLHRVDAHVVDIAGMLEYETSNLLGHHWWTVDEVAASTEHIVPWGLAALLAALPPADAAPVELPWHH